MTSDQAFLAVIDALNQLQLDYMVVGSFSSNFYGVSRSTQDADIVVELKGRSIVELAKRLEPDFLLDSQRKFEPVTMTEKYVFKLRAVPFEIEIFLPSKDDHDQERFQRRQRVSMGGRPVFLQSVEDVVVMKLRWAASRRIKDRDDLLNVIATSGDRIDWDYVYAWADRHGTRALLDEIRRSIPPG